MTNARHYALVDLAAAPELADAVLDLVAIGAAQCLFEGALPVALTRVSPFIVDLERVPGLVERWRREGLGRSWGIVMRTSLSMRLARRHVRRFTQVKLPDGSGPVLCRIWDPRVFRVLSAAQDDTWCASLSKDVVWYDIDQERA